MKQPTQRALLNDAKRIFRGLVNGKTEDMALYGDIRDWLRAESSRYQAETRRDKRSRQKETIV